MTLAGADSRMKTDEAASSVPSAQVTEAWSRRVATAATAGGCLS